MNAIEAIAAERQRQIEVEGWTPEHDDKHIGGELALAASGYAIAGADLGHYHRASMPARWPWDRDWWKPSANCRRNLIKAGALIVAEIERLDRLSPKEPGQS